MRAWEEHFDGAIKGAKTTMALRQLQGLPAPHQRLTDKLAANLRRLEKRERAQRNSTPRIASGQEATA
jgi:hypothetical protein